MSSTFRIPPAEPTGLKARLVTAYSRRRFGQTLDGVRVYWHNQPVLDAVFGLERKAAKWSALPPDLRTYATIATAARIGCSWCLDFGYFHSQADGLDPAKVSQVPRWRSAAGFSPLEREVLAYAEAMTATPPEVTDAMVAGLVDRLGAAAVVELTQVVALENMRARFNVAAGIESQGFSAACEIPLAAAPPATADSTS